MAKEPSTNVPDRLLVELIGAKHDKAERQHEEAGRQRSLNNYDIARNIDLVADGTATAANEARALLGLPPYPYKDLAIANSMLRAFDQSGLSLLSPLAADQRDW